MKTRVVLNRGSNTENDLFTGFPGEIVYDTTNQTIRIHDGTTVGGSRLATISPNNQFTANTLVSIGLTSNSISSNTINANVVTISTSNTTTAFVANAQITSLTSTNSTIISLSSNTIQANSVTVSNQPTSNNQLTNKSYVDRQVRLAIALSGI